MGQDYKEILERIQMKKDDVNKIREGDTEHRYANVLDMTELRLEEIRELIMHNIDFFERYTSRKNNGLSDSPIDNLCGSVIDFIEEINCLLEPIPFVIKEGSPIYNSFNNPNISAVLNNLSAISNKITDIQKKNLILVFEILKHLEGHNKTLIILGPNGCGKTSFANFIKRADTHVKVIPALKPLRSSGNMYSVYNATIDSFNSEIFNLNNSFNEDLLQKLIVGLCSENDDVARKYYNTDDKYDSKFKIIESIFNDFFDVELDDSQFSGKQIMARKAGKPPFPFNNMSDGERAAFFNIATVVVAPEKSFIIVDEPENHLNPAVYNKIWDRLIFLRSDCQFIFISHSLEFIKARSNYELVRIKEFSYPDKFDFDFFSDELDEVDTEYIVEIVGSRRPLLFCEGTKNDYDYKIYEILFGSEYTIIPTGSCLEVIKNVEACNQHSIRYGLQKAIGIIDSDLRSEEEKRRLKDKWIFVLKCNEIEMLLVDEAIFKQVMKHIFKDENTFSDYSKKFFKTIENRKEEIIRRLVKTQIDELFKHSVIDDKNNKTKEELKNNFESIISSVDIEKMWNESDSLISEIINEENYEAALRYCCLEHKEIIGGVCNDYAKDYANLAIGVLSENDHLKEEIKKKYLSDL